MAITWRNIGQSSNQGNSLISGAADTINRGLGQIRESAREVGQEQIRQYDTQADLNTANILNQVQSASEDGLSQFDINNLSSQFGSQFDANAITTGIGDRTNQLRTIARQANQDQLAQDSFGLDQQRTASTIALNQQRADLATASASKIQQTDNYTAQALSNLGQYASAEDARRQVIKNAPEGINATVAADAAAQQWQAAIGTAKYTPIFEQAALQGQQQVDTLANEMQRKLDTHARSQGLTPTLLKLSEDTSVDEGEIYAYYNDKIKNSNIRESSVEPFKQLFKSVLGRLPNGAEARHFLPSAFVAASVGDDGLSSKRVKDELIAYRDQVGDSDKVNWYRQASNTINKAKNEYAPKALSDIRKLQKKEISNNTTRFKGDYVESPVTEKSFDPTKYINTDTLIDSSWLYKDFGTQPKKEKPKKVYNPNTNTFTDPSEKGTRNIKTGSSSAPALFNNNPFQPKNYGA